MNEKRKSGDAGESYACELLIKKGYEILERNYHSRYGEIDIIARKGDTLVFAEVKARKQGSLVSGVQAVSPEKQRKIILTSYCYLENAGEDIIPRYDVISLTLKNEKIIRCEHISSAFTTEAVSDNF